MHTQRYKLRSHLWKQQKYCCTDAWCTLLSFKPDLIHFFALFILILRIKWEMQWDKDLVKNFSYLEDFANLQSLVWENEIWFRWKFSCLKEFVGVQFLFIGVLLVYKVPVLYKIRLLCSFMYDEVRLLCSFTIKFVYYFSFFYDDYQNRTKQTNAKNPYIYQALLPSTVNLTMYSFFSIIPFQEWHSYFSFIHTS